MMFGLRIEKLNPTAVVGGERWGLWRWRPIPPPEFGWIGIDDRWILEKVW
jgi:hypothetical protein